MEGWKDTLDPAIKDHGSIQNFESPADLAKAYVNAQSLINGEKLALPTAPDDPNWNTVYNRLGRPEEAKDYKLTPVEGLPEGFQVEEKNITEYLEVAHGLGLTQKQADGLFAHYIKQQGGSYKGALDSIETGRKAGEKALRAEWGNGFDANRDLALKTLKFAAGDDADALAAAYGNDPRIVRMLAKVGNAMSEDILGAGSPKPGELTPDVAQKEIDAIMANPEHPYFKATHPEHNYYVNTRMPELFAQANPDGAD